MSTAVPPVTGLVITFNEADRIEECLHSMRPVCRQLVVVDAGSTDGTIEAARRAGAEVTVASWRGYGRQRNHALRLAKQPWSLFLDADERLSTDLAAAIAATLGDEPTAAAQPYHAYDLAFRTVFLGSELRHGAAGREHHIRLFRSDLRFTERSVHEGIDAAGCKVGRLPGHVLHHTARDYAHYERKLARYAELFATDGAAHGRRSSITRARTRALYYWLKNYWLRAGFLDGAAGYVYHRMHAGYVFAKHAQLWERNASSASLVRRHPAG